MSKSLIVVVTGSNRGIGHGIVQLLAKTEHTSSLTIIATSRSGDDLGIHVSSSNTIQYAKLDIGSSPSVKSFFESTQNIDVLINNAGVNNNHQETPDLAAQTININYKGTRDMCMAALFSSKGKISRIVNVSSTASQLNNYDQSIQGRFHSVKNVQEIDNLANAYIKSIRSAGDAQKQAGFGDPPKSYQVSKALMNALTVVLARENPDVLINCCCPGWVDTDMGHQVGRPPKTLEEGARIPVRLAIGDLGASGDKDGGLGAGDERVSGRYYGNEGVTDRGWGRARMW